MAITLDLKNTQETRLDKRKRAYPSVEDQLDMIWHMVDEYIPEAHASEFYQKIKRIKDIYGDNSIRHRHGYRFRSRARLT
jgi:ribosomal protein S13